MDSTDVPLPLGITSQVTQVPPADDNVESGFENRPVKSFDTLLMSGYVWVSFEIRGLGLQQHLQCVIDKM